MKTLRSTLARAAAAACTAALLAGCGPAVTEEERAAYEAAAFGNTPAPGEQATDPAEDAVETMLRPREWSGAALEKLCEQAEALLEDAENGLVILPEKARAAAEKVRRRC